MSTDPSLPGHWALAPFGTAELNDEHFLILRKSDGASAVLDAVWLPVLGELAVLRTLAEHAEIIAARIPSLQGNTPAVEALLVQLVDKGLFRSAAEFAAKSRQGAEKQGVPAGAPRIVIITCERPAALERLLASLAANEER
ncbi:MAG: hypothetical protein ABFS30_17480, partial [Pseudomonadota bacterium]